MNGAKIMKTLIIAEAGVNHNGKLELALEMVHKAAEMGADIIKFQTGIAELLISKFAEKAEYQKRTTGAGESQLDMVRRILLPLDDFKLIKAECEKTGIRFLSTPFDSVSIDYLHDIGVSLWKIPSGEITNLPYLMKIAAFRQPVILSTGMSELKEIEAAVTVLKEGGCDDITLLHCTTEYPALYEEVNLRAMNTMREHFGVEVGYSDHTPGIEVPVAAVAMGATVIEKHFTLDRSMEGPDHKASLEPDEFAKMVSGIRNIEKALGTGEKKPASSEIKNKAIARKSIVAKRAIQKGEILSEENVTVKRPGSGISPMRWFEVLGTTALRDFEEDELIEL